MRGLCIAKAFIVVTLLFLGILFLVKEGDKKDLGQIVRLNIEKEPTILDPRQVRDIRGVAYTHMLFEGLARMNKDGAPELALARDVSLSRDGKVYVLSLKESTWSDGTPLLAKDFIYAWKCALDPKFPCSNASMLYVIKNGQDVKMGKRPFSQLGAFALDEHTLVIELEHPTPYFLDLLTHPIFFPVPEHVDMQNSDWYEEARSYVSNGPFSLSEWVHGDYFSLEKNPLYWDADNVTLEKIDMVMRSQSESFPMYQKGELNWIGFPFSNLMLSTILNPEGEHLRVSSFLSTYFLRLSVSKSILSHRLIRKALSLAIDREKMAKNIILGKLSPAKTLVPPVMGVDSSSYLASDIDLKEARRLFNKGLQELSLSLSELPPITLIHIDGERQSLGAHLIAENWKEAFGFSVELKPLNDRIFFKRISEGDFDIAAVSWIADFNDPVSFLDLFKYKEAKTNGTDWENGQYTHFLECAASTQDKKERFAYLSDAESILMEEMPIIPLYHQTIVYMQKEHLRNVIVSPLGMVDFKLAYVEE